MKEEQVLYAKILKLGTRIGLFILIISFILYIFGIIPPYIPISSLPKYWAMSTKDYLKATSIPQGWLWISLLSNGDFLNFIGIAFLSGITIICFLGIIPIFYKKKDKIYFFLSLLQAIILLLAASGILVVD
ncbi:MAG: hypothetical protein AB1595_02615 [bacterium]